MENNNSHIDEHLILKHISNQASQHERQMVDEWLLQSKENQAYFNKIKQLVDKTEKLQLFDSIDTKKALHETKKRFPDEKKKPIVLYTSILKVAAVLIFFVLIGVIVKNYLEDEKNEIIIVETQNNQKNIKLPDGSKILLNKNSRLTYSDDFNQSNREISFQGEGFFEITKNKELPFRIMAQNSTVQVVGTAFSFRTFKDETNEKIVVTEGKVLFSENKSKKRVKLEKGDIGIVNKTSGKLEKKKNTDNNFLAWKTGILVFQNDSLGKVLAKINEHYNTKISCSDSVLLNRTIAAQYDNLQLEVLLEILANTINCKWENKNGTFVLSAKPNK